MWYIVLSRSLPDKEESKETITTNIAVGWRSSIRPAACYFRDRPLTARTGSISCWRRVSTKQKPSPPDSHHARGIRTMEVLEWRPHRAFRMDKLTIADVEQMARGE